MQQWRGQQQSFPRVKTPGTTDEEVAQLDKIKERHSWQMIQVQRYALALIRLRRTLTVPGTPAKVVRKRRAKNKQARLSRRLNRQK